MLYPSSLNIDARVDFSQLRSDLLSELNRLMPFGYTNPSPVFLAERVFLNRSPWTVGRNHLRLSLAQKPHIRQAIGFNMGDLAGSFAGNLSFNVAYTLDLDPNQPVTQQQLRLNDIQDVIEGDSSKEDPKTVDHREGGKIVSGHEAPHFLLILIWLH